MNLRDYYDSLDAAGQGAYAERAGFAPSTLRAHFFPVGTRQPRQSPGLRGLLRLADASEGAVTRTEAFDFFVEAIGRGACTRGAA